MYSSCYQTFRFQDVSLHVCCRAAPQPASGKTLTLLDTDDTTKQQTAKQTDDLLGLDVWPASLALADYLIAHHREYTGRCIELGAGTGIPGVLLATQHAEHVVLSDYEDKVLKLLRKTIAVNRVVEKCTTVALDWSTPNTWDPTLCRAFDLVLAADVVYASNAAQPCAAAIDAVLGEHGVVLMAHQVRHAIYFDSKAGKVVKEAHDGPLELFREACVKLGLDVQQQPLQPHGGGKTNEQDELLLLTIRRNSGVEQNGGEHNGGEAAAGDGGGGGAS